MTTRALLLFAAAWLAALACSASGQSGPAHGQSGPAHGDQSPKGPAVDASACESLRGKVMALYERDGRTAPTASGAPAQEGPADHSADIEMMFADCRRDPGRVVPCIDQATDAAQLERDCLLPLDDQGTAEGAMFGQ